MKIRISRDEEGVLRASTSDQLRPLSWFLEQDLQSATESCEAVMASIQAVMGGTESVAEMTGNAHTVTIRRDSVSIVNEFVDDDGGACSMSLEEFRDAVKRWYDAVRLGDSRGV